MRKIKPILKVISVAYGLVELIYSAFVPVGENDAKEAKAQNKAQDQTSFENVREA